MAAPAAVLAMPFVASALDEGNEATFQQGLANIESGNAEDLPGGLNLTQADGATMIGGDEDTLLQARMKAEAQGIDTHKVGPGLVSIRADPDNIRSLVAQDDVTVDRTQFSDYRSPQMRSYGSPTATALRG